MNQGITWQQFAMVFLGTSIFCLQVYLLFLAFTRNDRKDQ